MNVGVMKDYKLELRNLHVSDTLGWSRNWKFQFRDSSINLVSILRCSSLEHLKIETRLTDEMFESEMGEYVFLM